MQARCCHIYVSPKNTFFFRVFVFCSHSKHFGCRFGDCADCFACTIIFLLFRIHSTCYICYEFFFSSFRSNIYIQMVSSMAGCCYSCSVETSHCSRTSLFCFCFCCVCAFFRGFLVVFFYIFIRPSQYIVTHTQAHQSVHTFHTIN